MENPGECEPAYQGPAAGGRRDSERRTDIVMMFVAVTVQAVMRDGEVVRP